MGSTLLLIDIQLDYFPGGAYPLRNVEVAAINAQRLLQRFRDQRAPVVHLQHIEPASSRLGFLLVGSPGIEFHPSVAPAPGEPVIRKSSPNGFLDTSLAAELTNLGTSKLVIAGMMTSMCVDATTRAALDRVITTQVAQDACAAPDLEHDGIVVSASLVHAAFMASLTNAGATVRPVDQLLAI